MTSPNQDKPKSYTARLIDFLEENKVEQKTLDLIKEFASAESEKIELNKDKTVGIMNFGKFKGKKITEIFKLDPQYVKWMQKNNKYLSDDNKAIVDELLSQ
jgi:hypothetical protein